ncbi:MAG TPA: FkbM family methyltransferase [Puia sp.]|nr:FkbM family methyltransferase [Puia sp.]
MNDRKLIFDVGANDGSDTAFYLGLGYSVVAIEPNPRLAERLNDRFAAEIGAGRVKVVNVAVTEADCTEVALYLSEDDTQSSLIRSMAERAGSAKKYLVRGRGFCSLFGEFGLPWYCKIDIEGYDAAAVRGMSRCDGRPAFISCEAAGQPIGAVARDEGLLYDVLDALAAQGYRQFKLADQESRVLLTDAGHYDRLHSWPVRVRTKLERWLGVPGRRDMPGAASASGLFGDDLGGEWADYETTRRRLRMHFTHYDHYTKNKQFIFWVDIHGKY